MPAAPSPFPWDEVVAFCLGTLRLAPDAFWRLSFRELAAILAPHAATPPDRRALAALMAAHPDG